MASIIIPDAQQHKRREELDHYLPTTNRHDYTLHEEQEERLKQ